MKRIFQLLLATVFFLNFQTIHAQPCFEPTNVILLLPAGSGLSDIPLLQWDYNESCPLEYFEIEYGYAPFTPGMGEGTLISPVDPSPPYMYSLDGEATHAWIRAVCDPECDGNVGGDDSFGSNWVQADVVIIAPYELPEGSSCQTAPDTPVQTYEECSYQGTISYPDFIFYDQFVEFATPEPVNVPCSEEGVFAVYRKFTATEAGVVEISIEENVDADFGFVVYAGPCNNGEIVDCAESFSNPHTVEDLTPGEEYFVGFWQNEYSPYFFYGGDWIDYNSFYTTVKICEPGCGSFTISAGADSTLSCDQALPEPEYIVEGNWCMGYTVSVVETTTETGCGATVTRTYTVTDSLGNTTSDTQQFILTDDQPPVAVSVPENLNISCGENWDFESPEFIDNCSAQVQITHVLDTIFNDGCEMFIEESWQATDDCGNSTTVERSITIHDEVPPEIICPDSIEVFIADAESTYVLADLTIDAQVTDNCAESIALSQSIEPGTELSAGEHVIAMVASDGCYDTTCDVIVQVSISTGVRQEDLDFALFPNPSNGIINIQREDSSPLQVDVYDSRGRMIYSHQFNDQNFNFNLEHSASGIYTVRMKSASYSVIEQIVLK